MFDCRLDLLESTTMKARSVDVRNQAYAYIGITHAITANTNHSGSNATISAD